MEEKKKLLNGIKWANLRKYRICRKIVHWLKRGRNSTSSYEHNYRQIHQNQTKNLLKQAFLGQIFIKNLYPVKNYTRPIQCNYFVVDFTANLWKNIFNKNTSSTYVFFRKATQECPSFKIIQFTTHKKSHRKNNSKNTNKLN